MAKESYTYCRLCAGFKRETALVDVETETDDIINKLNRINAIADLQSSTLPKTCCIECMVALNGAYEFVLTVERAQNILTDVNQSIKQEFPEEVDTQNNLHQNVVSESSIEVKLEKQHAETVSDDTDHDATESDNNDNSSLLEKAPISELPVIPLENESGKTRPKKKVSKSPIKRKNVATVTYNKRRTDFKSLPTWKDYIWKCSICDTQFPTHVELKTHSMEFHKVCNAQRCFDCNLRRGSLDKFILHVRRHRKYFKYSCYTCFHPIATPHEAHLHKITHLSTPNICKGCNSTFKTIQELMEHTATYFKDICKPASKYPKSDDLTCTICNKTFGTNLGLSRHLVVHTERKRDHICDACGKTFHNKHNLKGHMAVHSDDRPFPCDICKQRFKIRPHLREHLKIHLAKRQHSCDQCGQSFKFRRNLEAHQIVHTDILPHVCVHCNKAFRFKSILNQHIRQHTGVKPYSCSVCNRQFTGWPNYNKHMKRRHNMDMAKRKKITASEDETINSEDVKKYVESYLETKRRGRTRTVKPLIEIIDPQSSLQEIIGQQPLLEGIIDEQPLSSGN